MIDIGRRPRKCRLCKSFDHDVRKCPERVVASAPAPEPSVPSDRIEAVARLREERDALTTEIGEYERVKATLEERLALDHARIINIDREIERLRGVR